MQHGYNYKEIYLLFKKYSNKIKYLNVKNILKAIYGLIIKRKIIINGLNDGKSIEKLINEMCIEKNVKNINEVKIPLLIPSVDIHTGNIYCFCSKEVRKILTDEIIYISDVNIGRAVRASCSYPAVFSPCPYRNLELIDGGIRENVPWQETKNMGADKVISVVFEKELSEKCCDNLIDVVSNSMDILTNELANYELKGADYLLKIRTDAIGLLDMEKIDYLYELGYKVAKEKMQEIKLLIK